MVVFLGAGTMFSWRALRLGHDYPVGIPLGFVYRVSKHIHFNSLVGLTSFYSYGYQLFDTFS